MSNPNEPDLSWLETFYDHRSSQETLFNKRERHAEPLRNLYHHPKSQEHLRFSDSPAPGRDLRPDEIEADKVYDSPAWRKAQEESRKAEGIRTPPPETPPAEPAKPEEAKPLEPAKPAETEGAEPAALFREWDAAAARARETGYSQTADRIDEAKGLVTQLFTDYAVDPAEQAQIAAIIREQPAERSQEEMQATETLCMAELKRTWGDDTPRKVSIAQRVAKEAMDRAPWLEDILNSGAGSDVRLIRLFAAIGERRGYA